MKTYIREAKKADIPGLQELWKEMMDFHKERDTFFTRSEKGHESFATFISENIKNDDWLVLVATLEENLVGYSLATVAEYPPVFAEPRYGHIIDVAVTQRYRRSGVGQQLLKEVQEWLKKREVNRIELQVSVKNEISQAFWKKMGFLDVLTRMTKRI